MTSKKVLKMYPIMAFFSFSHLPDNLKPTAKKFSDLAWDMAWQRPYNSPEVAAGLRRLLEAKDCLVRAKLEVK